MDYVVLFLLVGLPVAWLISEFQPRRGVRITLGLSSLALSFFLAWAVGIFSSVGYEDQYSSASSHLIDTVVANIEAGNTDELLQELRRLRTNLQPHNRTRTKYGELVEQFTKRLKVEKPNEPSPPSGGK